jgi:hypothetical protein
MVVENPTWGAPRIHGELLMLGFDVSERTISRWMKRAPRDREPARRWLTFLRNHREAIAAMDFFTVPTITFSTLYCFSSSVASNTSPSMVGSPQIFAHRQCQPKVANVAFIPAFRPRRERSSLGTASTKEWFPRWTTSGWADCTSVPPIPRQPEPSFSCFSMRRREKCALAPRSKEAIPNKVWA